MNLKLIVSIVFITILISIFSTNGVPLYWIPSPDVGISGYKIYWGTNSRAYNVYLDVGNVTNTTIDDTNFIIGKPYYFTATSYILLSRSESPFGDEVIWTNIPPNITYVGVKVDYGTILMSITSKQIMVMSVTNHTDYFYNSSLIITNNPFVGMKPTDTNNYTYLGTKIQFGSSLMSLTTKIFPLITFTNPPTYYYRSSLILTNKPF